MFHAAPTTVFFLTFCLGLATACKHSGFKAVNKHGNPGRQDLTFNCGGNKASSGTQDISGTAGKKIQVKGQFCSQLQATPKKLMTVLFMVDFSGSMEKADKGDGVTCARLDGAKAIMHKIVPKDTNSKALVLIKGGVVSFDADAREQSKLQTYPDFASLGLSYQNFCGQEGIATNYESAFKVAANMLANEPGGKMVLLFSDGIPNHYDGMPHPDADISDEDRAIAQKRGEEAAVRLRALADVKLKIAYLKYTGQDSENANPEGYLGQLVEDKTRDVRVASNVEQFVEQAEKIDLPPPVIVNNTSAEATLKSAGLPNKTVNVSITESQQVPGIWDYVTEPFALGGEKGVTTVYELVVQAKSSDGTVLESNVTINFKRK